MNGLIESVDVITEACVSRLKSAEEPLSRIDTVCQKDLVKLHGCPHVSIERHDYRINHRKSLRRLDRSLERIRLGIEVVKVEVRHKGYVVGHHDGKHLQVIFLRDVGQLLRQSDALYV